MSTATVVEQEYLAMYEAHCEAEQLERDKGDEAKAEKHHQAALAVLWAYDAERMDPVPPGLA